MEIPPKTTICPICDCGLADLACCHCRRPYHRHCLRQVPGLREFLCPQCRVRGIDPLNQVVEVLGQSFLNFSLSSREKFSFTKGSTTQDGLEVELRCMRLQGGQCDISFPDSCQLLLNDKKVADYKPLGKANAVKKRKDARQILNKFQIREKNTATIQEVKLSSTDRNRFRVEYGSRFFCGVYLVRKLKPEELCKKAEVNRASKQESVKLLRMLLQNQDSDIKVTQIKVTLVCNFTFQKIRVPVRGDQCQHFQCFCLKNFATLMRSQEVRHWRCPVCDRRCQGFRYDEFFDLILAKSGLSNEVVFRQDESFYFVQEDSTQSEQEERPAEEPSPLPSSACEEAAITPLKSLGKSQLHSFSPKKIQVILIEDSDDQQERKVKTRLDTPKKDTPRKDSPRMDSNQLLREYLRRKVLAVKQDMRAKRTPETILIEDD